MGLLTELLRTLNDTNQIQGLVKDHRSTHSGQHFKEVVEDPEKLAEILEEHFNDPEEKEEVMLNLNLIFYFTGEIKTCSPLSSLKS